MSVTCVINIIIRGGAQMKTLRYIFMDDRI